MTAAGVRSDGLYTIGRATGRGPARPQRSAPGVAVESVGPLFRQPDLSRSDVGGFVGFAARGHVQRALRVANHAEFDDVFGKALPGSFLAHAVDGFFANGGRICWVVRAADPERATPARAPVIAGVRFAASSAGTWANGLEVEVRRADAERVTIVVSSPDGRREVWPRQSARVESLRRLLSGADDDPSASALLALEIDPGVDESEIIDATTYVLRGGEDGLDTITTSHLTGQFAGQPLARRVGAALFDDIEEIGLVVIPDLALREPRPPLPPPPRPRCPAPLAAPSGNTALADVGALPVFALDDIAQAQSDLLGACEALHDRIALVNHPNPKARPDEVVRWREGLHSAFGAIYWPWLQVVDPSRRSEVLSVPPCGHVAGIVARSDWAEGPHKPPANELVVGAVGVTVPIEDESHGEMNAAGVNAIRTVAGRGIRVLGARTTSAVAEWRYINVRRLVSQIERTVARSAQWLVFEPDERTLREELERVIRTLLDDLWRAGGLDGRTAEEAYFVTIDTAPTGAGGDEGRVIAEIGLLPPWPAEFIVVRIDVTQAGVRPVSEGGARRALDR